MWWSTQNQKQVTVTASDLVYIIVTRSQILCQHCLFAEKSLWGRVWWLSPTLIPVSLCIVLLSCLPHVCVMVSLSLSGSLALHWMTFFYYCFQTDRHTCELDHYCKTVKLVCLCLVRLGHMCVWVCVWKYMLVCVLREGVQRLLGMTTGKSTSALIWSLSFPVSR